MTEPKKTYTNGFEEYNRQRAAMEEKLGREPTYEELVEFTKNFNKFENHRLRMQRLSDRELTAEEREEILTGDYDAREQHLKFFEDMDREDPVGAIFRRRRLRMERELGRPLNSDESDKLFDEEFEKRQEKRRFEERMNSIAVYDRGPIQTPESARCGIVKDYTMMRRIEKK